MHWHVEKFGLFFKKNLNNLWSIIKVYAVFVPNLYEEQSAWKKSVWKKNDEYEVWLQIVAKSPLNFLVESMCWSWWQWRDAFPADVLPVVCVLAKILRGQRTETQTPPLHPPRSPLPSLL